MAQAVNPLAGRTALVTGASGGAGVDIARELARAGARVAVHYRSARGGASDRPRSSSTTPAPSTTGPSTRSARTKAALLHLTETLALELAPAITVNAVVPSQIASARTDTMPDYKAGAIASTPLGRMVTAAEIARMVVLVCSPEFDFVIGRPIVLDGGRALPAFPRINLQ